MAHDWETTKLESEEQTLDLLAELRGKQWLCRGHSEPYDNLEPRIDREPRHNMTRIEKLKFER